MTPPEVVNLGEDVNSLSQEVYREIESSNWAPWLRVAPDRLAQRMEVFPEGHLVVREDDGQPIGLLSTNRIHWDGRAESLTTWGTVAGSQSNFQDTYDPTGNTVCLMSMGVAAGAKGQRIAEQMVQEMQRRARETGVEHIIGDFRPSGFGHYKHMNSNFDFQAYVESRRPDGLLLDPWLRNVSYLGMSPVRVDNRAMVVSATADQLRQYMREYKPEAWYEVEDPADQKVLLEQHQPQYNLHQVTHIYECEETGTWYLDADNGQAVYIESNLWGELPVNVAQS